MFKPKESELEALLTKLGNYYSVVSNPDTEDEFYEITSKILTLFLSPTISKLPIGSYIIAGGAVRSVFFNEIPADIDVFIPGDSVEINSRMDYLAQLFLPKQANNTLISVPYENGFVKKLRLVEVSFSDIPYTIQFIGQWFVRVSDGKEFTIKSAEDVISYFDIIPICYASQIYMDKNRQWSLVKTVTHPLLYKTLANKELRINKYGNIALKSMRAIRFYKYISEYGFRIPSSEDMTSFDVLLSRGNTLANIEYA